MRPLLLILLLAPWVYGQTTEYDKFTGNTYTYSKRVDAYRNTGGALGLLAYNPAKVIMQAARSGDNVGLLFEVDSFDWQFIGDCNIPILVDEERQTLPCSVVYSKAYTLQSSVYVREILAVKMSINRFRYLTEAKSLEMRVGAYEFRVKDKHLKELKKVLPP